MLWCGMNDLLKWPDLLHDWLKEYWPHGMFIESRAEWSGFIYCDCPLKYYDFRRAIARVEKTALFC